MGSRSSSATGETSSVGVFCETEYDRRLRKAWKGGYIRFHCHGAGVSTGSQARPLIITLGAQILGIILLMAFPIPYLTRRFETAAYAVIATVLSVLTLYFFVRTSLTDPGILPRYPKAEPGSKTLRPPRAQKFVQDTTRKELRFCDQCQIFQPPRTWHCPICRNCIRTYDHHCPWIGNCIGERNYPLFFAFVTFVTLLISFTIVISILELVTRFKESEPGDALLGGLGTLIILALAFIVSWFTYTLFFFHLSLLMKNQTTYEHIRGFGSDLPVNYNPEGVGIQPTVDLCFKNREPSYVCRWIELENQAVDYTNAELLVDAVYAGGNTSTAKEVSLSELDISSLLLNKARDKTDTGASHSNSFCSKNDLIVRNATVEADLVSNT